VLGALLLCSGVAGAGESPDKPKAPDYVKQVKPLFAAKCIGCHGAKQGGGKLDMRTLSAMLTGGATGPAFVPGDAKKSLLIELIHYNEMPPKKKQPRVTRSELEMLRAWINHMKKEQRGVDQSRAGNEVE